MGGGNLTKTYPDPNSNTPPRTYINCTTDTSQWTSWYGRTNTLGTIDNSPCLLTPSTPGVYDWTTADYLFTPDNEYTVHAEIYIPKTWGYMRIGFTTPGDLNNQTFLHYYHEGKWDTIQKTNGTTTTLNTVSVGYMQSQIWTNIDFHIKNGQIYTTYTQQDGSRIQEKLLYSFSEDFYFGISSWSSQLGIRQLEIRKI